MTRFAIYFAVIAFSVLHPSTVRIYKPMDLYELTGNADVAAVGEIVEVREKTFVLKVHRVLFGEHGQVTFRYLDRRERKTQETKSSCFRALGVRRVG
ncbi:MAG: hypothetical protein ABL921_31940, partial [Pirellula sp.]